MRSPQFKILLGGLAVLLAVVACSTASPAMPTIVTFQVRLHRLLPSAHGHRRPPPGNRCPGRPGCHGYRHPGPGNHRPQPASPAGSSLPIHPVPVHAGRQ